MSHTVPECRKGKTWGRSDRSWPISIPAASLQIHCGRCELDCWCGRKGHPDPPCWTNRIEEKGRWRVHLTNGRSRYNRSSVMPVWGHVSLSLFSNDPMGGVFSNDMQAFRDISGEILHHLFNIYIWWRGPFDTYISFKIHILLKLQAAKFESQVFISLQIMTLFTTFWLRDKLFHST